jgi:hypothetical protein
VTLTAWLLIGLLGIVAALLVVVVRAVRWLRESAAELRTLVTLAGASTRITSAKPTTTRDAVHLVLMDQREQQVEFVMRVPPNRRAYSVTHDGRLYACVSGSVDEGFFVYRRT